MGIEHIGYISGGAAVGFLAWWLYSVNRGILRKGKGTRAEDESPTGIFAALMPYATLCSKLLKVIPEDPDEAGRGIVGWLFKFIAKFRLRIRRKLMIAGNPMGIKADEVMGLMVVTSLVGIAFGFFFKLQLDYLAVPIVCGLLGFFFPMIWVNDKAKKRQHKIRRALPYALDLLTLAVEAGLDFGAALMRIASKLGDTPLSQEVGMMLREIRMGKSRRDALRGMGNRVCMEELSIIVSALVQADELGSSLGPILRIQSDQLRLKRSQRAEKLAMEAPVKMLAPLIGCIFPTVFIIIFGPIALTYFLQQQVPG